MAGFPAGNTLVVGGFIALLDACLVNGANLTTAVGVTQTGGVATLAFAGNHNFNMGDRVLVDGAMPAAYNGLKVVTAITANSASFAVDSGTASPATGTVMVKHPGAGWAKSWADGNKAAYRSATSDGGVGAYLQVEDDNPYNDSHASFRWRPCEGHTGLNTATRLATDLRQFHRNGGPTNWWCVADDRTAYIGFVSSSVSTMFSFGELTRRSPTDTGAWVFPARSVVSSDTGVTHQGITYGARSDGTGYTPYQALKTWSGFEVVAFLSPTLLGCPAAYTGAGYTAASLSTLQYDCPSPNPMTGAVEMVAVQAMESLGTSWSPGNRITRGAFRGAYQLYGKLPDAFFDARKTGVLRNVDINGVPRTVVCADVAGGHIAFDLTGPWG